MLYKIGKIAKILGVTPEAIRHYERLGLIVPYKDKESNYRYYTNEHIDQLLYIQRFSSMGISLADIRENILQGDIHTYHQMVKHKKGEYLQELDNLQLKLMNVDHYLDVLNITTYCLYECICKKITGVYFISKKRCLDLKDKHMDISGWDVTQEHADLFFQCSLFLFENHEWIRTAGFGIYEDCAEAIGVFKRKDFQFITGGDAVIYAIKYSKKHTVVNTDYIRDYCERNKLRYHGPLLQRIVYQTFKDADAANRVEMLMIPVESKDIS